MVPMSRMATWGWLNDRGAEQAAEAAGFVTVNVPPCTSSTLSFFRAGALGEVAHGPGQASTFFSSA